MINDQHIERIKNKLRISEIIKQKIKLKKFGHEFQAICPFHQENTPSFTVNDSKGFYHCFGCGAHGDMIQFLIEFDKISFVEAAKLLAIEAGIEIDENNEQDVANKIIKSKLREILIVTQKWYRQQIKDYTEVRKYLLDRGIHDYAIDLFQLGYAPSSNKELIEVLHGHQFTKKDCIESGIITHDGKMRFVNRIIFPIHNHQNLIVGFGSRIFDIMPEKSIHTQQVPKYINSPESILFHKSDNLYGINKIKQCDEMILVEGYVDVIQLNQHGIKNVVATMGTAVKIEQISKIWKFCDNIVILFDGDNGGQNATAKIILSALSIIKTDKKIYTVQLPYDNDPDEYVRKNGPQAIIDLIKNKKFGMMEYLWQWLLQKNPINSYEDIATIDKKSRELSSQVNDHILKSHYSSFFKNAVWQLKNQYTKNERSSRKLTNATVKDLFVHDSNKKIPDKNILLILKIIIHHPNIVLNNTGMIESLIEIDHQELSIIVDVMQNILNDDTEIANPKNINQLIMNYLLNNQNYYGSVIDFINRSSVIDNNAIPSDLATSTRLVNAMIKQCFIAKNQSQINEAIGKEIDEKQFIKLQHVYQENKLLIEELKLEIEKIMLNLK